VIVVPPSSNPGQISQITHDHINHNMIDLSWDQISPDLSSTSAMDNLVAIAWHRRYRVRIKRTMRFTGLPARLV
jgi:hypothetical protein